MKIALLVEKLNLRIKCGEDKLDREVCGGYVGDLLSDVIANSAQDNIWITRQAHQNIVAVAALKEHAGVILALGQEPENDTIAKATKEGIPLLITDLSGFEISGKIYELMKE